jgi:hypothetical protein
LNLRPCVGAAALGLLQRSQDWSWCWDLRSTTIVRLTELGADATMVDGRNCLWTRADQRERRADGTKSRDECRAQERVLMSVVAVEARHPARRWPHAVVAVVQHDLRHSTRLQSTGHTAQRSNTVKGLSLWALVSSDLRPKGRSTIGSLPDHAFAATLPADNLPWTGRVLIGTDNMNGRVHSSRGGQAGVARNRILGATRRRATARLVRR